MEPTDTAPSFRAAVAIAFGAVKATDLAKQTLRDIGSGNIPAQPKALVATGVAVALSWTFEHGTRRKVLLSCASAGLASLLHSTERFLRAQGDVSRILAVNQGLSRRR